MNKLTFENEQEVQSAHDHFPYQSFSDIPVYEQRYLPRWEAEHKAYYRLKEQPEVVRTHIKDLSATGACLEVGPEVHANQKIQAKIYLTDKVNFTISGIILWKRTADAHSYAGVLFDPLPEETQDLLLEHAFQNN